MAAQASLTLIILPILADLAVRRAPPELGEYLGAIGGLLPAPVRDVPKNAKLASFELQSQASRMRGSATAPP